MGLFTLLEHFFRIERDYLIGYLAVVLVVIQGGNCGTVSADARLVQGLYQLTGVDVKPTSSQITETYQGTHRLDCAMRCSLSPVCLTYSVTNLTTTTTRPRYECNLAEISSLGTLLKTTPSTGTILYARKILFCTRTDISLKSSSSNAESELTVTNKSGRKIIINWIDYQGEHVYNSMVDKNGQWKKKKTMQGHSFFASDFNGQIVPLNGNCHFTKGKGPETVDVSFGF